MSHSIKLNFNDTKGNWEYSDFQKPPKRREKKQHEEQNIKMLLQINLLKHKFKINGSITLIRNKIKTINSY